MNWTHSLITTLLAGFFAVSSPIVVLLVKRHLDNKDKLPIDSMQRRGIEGIWIGTVEQDEIGEDRHPGQFQVRFDLAAKQKTVMGKLKLVGETENEEFSCEGGFLYDRFLQLNYVASDRNAMQFGACLLELNARGDELCGEFLGYGKESARIVSGRISLSKQ